MTHLDFSEWPKDEYPYLRHDPMSALLKSQRQAFIGRPFTYQDLFHSEMFIRLWTLLHKYGELYHHAPITGKWGDIYTPSLNGHCIQTALEVSRRREKSRKSHVAPLEYAEGITTQCPFSIHAANVVRNSKYDAFIDYTRPVHEVNRHLLRFKSILFDDDFHEYVYRAQTKNKCDILPYLTSHGKCCLTYKPLIMGDIEGFRYTEEDAEEACRYLGDFAELHMAFDWKKDQAFHLSKKERD